MDKSYSHREVERKWYSRWLEAEYFAPFRPDAPAYSMVIPPPNVTGSLHMGHALNNTLQDILARYKRMAGFNVLWLPGTDHAGIATQNVVERQLASRGLTRWQIGREKFIEHVWRWKDEAGNTILNQLKALGVSCDWSRQRFTMDEGLSHAVREAFVCLWEDGFLYRAERLINWCPRCKTALADIEVVHEDAMGSLWHIRYPLQSDPSRWLVVATTRPETMLGDTAVAVHPDDPRYRGFVGKKVRLPIVGRELPVIADAYVDPSFGTGALKITPAHDFNDSEIGEKYGIKKINIFDADARIAPEAFVEEFGGEPAWIERYRGKDRYEVRKLIVEDLQKEGLLEKVEPHNHAVGKCYRCYTPVEPYLTPQWFVKIRPLAEPAIEAVRSGRIKIVPEGWANSYFAWMENIKDWTISRQIWWGHQIPAWYCTRCDADQIARAPDGSPVILKGAKPLVGREAPKSCPDCGGTEFVRDSDVLDTWFSSGLWPFSTLGWPEKTEDLRRFYPTSVLVTGFDILFFWVARMIMMGMRFMGEVPFHDVYIHALVRDEEGQKMSKSKGNVIDPLEIMERFGTDSFRFTLAALSAMGRDVKLSEDRIAGYQNFVNKLWNAARFVLLNVEGSDPVPGQSFEDEDLNLADRWILSRLNRTIDDARRALDGYRFNEFAHHLYQFIWHEFCDWYIEMSKLSLNGTLGDSPDKTRKILVSVLEPVLLLLHPAMPFVTEEIRHAFAPGKASIMVDRYPESDSRRIQNDVEAQMEFLIDVVRAIRNLRAEMNCPPSKPVRIVVLGSEHDVTFLKEQEAYVRSLARVSSIEYAGSGGRPKGAATTLIGSTEIYLPLEDLVNLKDERHRLMKEIPRVEQELARVQKKLENQAFLTNAKEEVVEKEKGKLQEFEEKLHTLQRSLQRIDEISQSGDGL